MNKSLFNKFNNIRYENVFEYLSYSLIIFLISGPAIPDIIVTIISFFFLIKIIKDRYIDENFLFILFCFFLLLIPNFFSIHFPEPFIEQMINIRYFLFALCLATLLKIKLEIIIKIMLCSTLLISFDLGFQYIFKFNIIGLPINPNHDLSRASSFFRDELIAGTYILKFSLPVIGYYLFKNKFIFSYALILIYLIAIIFSGERMSFLLYGLGILILLIFYNNFKEKIIIIFSILIICFSSFYLFDGVKSRTDNFIVSLGFKEENLRDFGHPAHYMTAYEIFKKNILTGTGHKTFRIECDDKKIREKINSKSQGCATHPHNNYLEMMSDSGLIGLTGFILFGLFIIIKSIKNKILFSEKNGFLISAIIIFWPISSAGNFFNNRIAITNFLIFGILLYFCKKDIFLKD